MKTYIRSVLGMALALPLFCQTIPGKFYEYQILSMNGQTPANAGQALTGLGAPSINSNGTVAYYGQFTGGEGIVAASPTLPATLISFAPPATSRFYGLTCQINDSEQVLASDFTSGSPSSYFDRLWFVKTPGTSRTLIRGGSGQPYNAVLSNGSVNHNGDAVMPALDHASNTILVSYKGGSTAGQLTLPSGSFAFPMIADNGSIILRWGNQPNSGILLYDQSLTTVSTIADSTKFNVLGNQPGISADGLIVAFYGEPNTNGAATVGPLPGIFASIDTGGGARQIVRVTGIQAEELGTGGNDNGFCDPGETCLPAAELGYDDQNHSISFSSYSKDTRIAVANLGLGLPGIDDDSFIISFIATPTGASRTNPVTGHGIPLLFSSQQGLWTIRVDAQSQLAAPNDRVFHPRTAIPVVQVFDQLGAGNTVESISVFNQVALAGQDDTGHLRTIRPGDHRVAFQVTTLAGQQLVVRGSHLDSDQDGLLDHWETTGIDMDQDGVVDLNLQSMGADPNKRDIFMEIDWLSDQPGFKFQPVPGVISPSPGQITSPLVSMFKSAPALTGSIYGARLDGGTPAAIPAGITPHIDGGTGTDTAGRPLSINMGTGTLDGGDQIGASGTSSSGLAEIVYFGVPGSLTIPGVTTRAFQDIKDNYFGLHEKDGRELAFHYVVMVNTIGAEKDSAGAANWTVASATATTLTSSSALPSMEAGDVVKITGGKDSGQSLVVSAVDTVNRKITVFGRWTTIPDATSTFAVMQGNMGIAEVFFNPGPDNNSLPGNDLMIAMGAAGMLGYTTGGVLGQPCLEWRTLAHELGHTLGLRHGGTDQNAYKGTAFLSLMSYSYVQACSPISAVQSYSNSSTTWNDWLNLQDDFSDVAFHLGNSLESGFWSAQASSPQLPELTGVDFMNQNGPPDTAAPTITIQSPAAGAHVGLTLPLQVVVNATDNAQVASVSVTFDVNGDGDTADSGENVQAKLSGTTYKAGLPALSGATGSRTITVSAVDASGNSATKTETVSVVAPNPVPVLASLSPGSATHGGPAFTLTVNGSNFVSGAIVQWNGSARSTAFVNAGRVTAKISASDIATAGTATVTLKNPAPGGGTSNGLTFHIN